MKQSLGADPDSIRIPESVKIMRLSGRMRGGGKHGFQALTHRLRRSPSPGGRGFMARSWILRLRLMAARRMTALLEGSKNQMGMMRGFSPVLMKQILLT